ncbi:MAG TPA: hypothetical protein VFE65_03430 [Pseudonocardia sp.]|jgi:hypothetical protein|nr:hypothetical protein [Pseudonocardia sp.]
MRSHGLLVRLASTVLLLVLAQGCSNSTALKPQATLASLVGGTDSGVHRNPSGSLSNQDDTNEIFNDMRNWRLSDGIVANRLRNAGWGYVQDSDVTRFGYDACYAGSASAARTMVAKLPDLVPRDATLVTDLMGVIPQHCQVLRPQAVDAAANVFFVDMIENANRYAPPGRPVTSTGVIPQQSLSQPVTPSSENQSSSIKATCAVGGAVAGGLIKENIKNKWGNLFALAALAGGAVYCPSLLSN